MAHTMLVIVWELLSKGVDYETWKVRRETETHTRRLIRQLEAMGLLLAMAPAA